MTGIDGDVAGADGVGVQGDVTGIAACKQQQVAGGADASCGGGTRVDRDAASRGDQEQLAVGPCCRQVLLGVCRGGGCQASSGNTFDRQAQAVNRDIIALRQVGATRFRPGAELGHRCFDTVNTLTDGSAGHQDQVGGGDVHCGVAQDVEYAAGVGQDGDLACGLAASRDFTQGDIAGAGCVTHVAAGALRQSAVCHGDGVVGQQVDGHRAETGKDVGIGRVLQNAVFGCQRDVAARAGDAGVEGEVGIACRSLSRLTSAEQNVACGAGTCCLTGAADGHSLAAIHGDGTVGGDQNQVAKVKRAGAQRRDKVLLFVDIGGGQTAVGAHARHGQTQVGDRDCIGLGDEGAAVG